MRDATYCREEMRSPLVKTAALTQAVKAFFMLQ